MLQRRAVRVAPSATRENDVYIAPQSRQEAQKPFHGVLSEAAPQQARQIGSRQPDQLCRVDLLEAALSNDLVDPRDQLGLEQMRVGIRESQVSEYVSTTAFDLHIVVLYRFTLCQRSRGSVAQPLLA